jgi:hypothetical protein
MSTIQLTRTQHRQMQKLADRVDHVSQADRRYFERFPHRTHRVRIASQAEIAQYKIIDGGPVFLPPRCQFFVAVRNIAPGVRLRLFVPGLEGSETDLDEATAYAIFEMATTEQTRKIEASLASLREHVRARG